MTPGYGILAGESLPLKSPAIVVQITIFKNMGGTIGALKQSIDECKQEEMDFIVHPVDYFLSETRPDIWKKHLEELKIMADLSQKRGLILHDETTVGSKRLRGEFEKRYEEGILELSRQCHVSIENAANTPDALWFWTRFNNAGITLDIGHLEAAGLNSLDFVETINEDVLDRMDYVHIHTNNGPHIGNVTDHWPLTPDCREFAALKKLVGKKTDFCAILEIIEKEALQNNLLLLEEV